MVKRQITQHTCCIPAWGRVRVTGSAAETFIYETVRIYVKLQGSWGALTFLGSLVTTLLDECVDQSNACQTGREFELQPDSAFRYMGYDLLVFVLIFWRVCEIAKSDYQLHHVCLSVRTSASPSLARIQLPMDGLSLMLEFEYYSIICPESCIKI